jgi:hypothetical protein
MVSITACVNTGTQLLHPTPTSLAASGTTQTTTTLNWALLQLTM